MAQGEVIQLINRGGTEEYHHFTTFNASTVFLGDGGTKLVFLSDSRTKIEVSSPSLKNSSPTPHPNQT